MKIKANLIFLVIALIISHNTLLAQTKNKLQFDGGFAFCGTGDKGGYILSLEYERAISSKLAIAPSIDYISLGRYEPGNPDGFSIGSGPSFETTMYYYLSRNNNVNLKIGLGAYIRQYFWMFEAPHSPNSSVTTSYFDISNGEQAFYTEGPSLGYSISIGLEIPIGDSFVLSFRQVLQNDTNGDITHTSRFGTGIKF